MITAKVRISRDPRALMPMSVHFSKKRVAGCQDLLMDAGDSRVQVRRADVEVLIGIVARVDGELKGGGVNVNRPGSGGGIDPTEGWSHASTTEVPG